MDFNRFLEFWDAIRPQGGNPPQDALATDAAAGISTILRSALEPLGASALAVYRSNGNQPSLSLFSAAGDFASLPSRLPIQDMVYLRKPLLWRHDQRSHCSLHREIRAAKFSYAATVPLGHEHALVGLLALVGNSACSPEALPFLETIGYSISLALQFYARELAFLDELQGIFLALKTSQATIDNVAEALILLSPELTVVGLNQSAEMILGYSAEEAAGQPVNNLLIGHDDLLSAFQQVSSANARVPLREMQLYRRNGDSFMARMSALSLLDGDKPIGILVLVQDYTGEAEMLEQNRRLEQRAYLGDVNAALAHEVRNPIHNLTTGLDLLAINMPADDSNRKIVEKLQVDCDRLTETMKSVLAFSRPTDYPMTRVNIDQLVRRVFGRLERKFGHTSIDRNLSVQPDLPAVRGNTLALEQVFTNLFENAIQAMGDSGGSLAVRLELEPVSHLNSGFKRNVRITVADTGPGIPDEDLERIFQPYFTTREEGFGLGLAITKRIVAAHKGSIQPRSFPGGTVFTVLLPIDTSEPEEEVSTKT